MLGDAELDVLAAGAFAPLERLRHVGERIGPRLGEVDALAIHPAGQMGRHRHVGRERDDVVPDGQPAERGQHAAERFLRGGLLGIRLVERVGNGRRRWRRRR